MPTYTIPYASSRLYQHSSTLGELARLRGEQQADAIRQQGAISGQMWQNVGSTIGNTLGQLAQYKLEAPKREADALALATKQREARDVQQAKDIQRLALKPNDQGVLTYDRELLTREFAAAGIGDRVPGLLKSLDEADAAALGLKEAQQKFARQGLDALLNGVEASGATPQAFKAAAEYGVANKLFSRAEAQQFVARAEAEPAAIPQMIAALRGEKPKPLEVSAGATLIDPVTRQPIYTAPAKRETPTAGTFGDYLTSYASDIAKKPVTALTAADKEDAKRRFEAAGRAPKEVDPAIAEMRQLNIQLAQARLDELERRKTTLNLSTAQQTELGEMKTLNDLATEALKGGEQSGWAGTGGGGYGSMADWAARNLGVGSKEGADLRAQIANITGTLAKLRGGTAFSESEKALLERYTPTINDSPLSMVSKLEQLQQFLISKADNLLAVASQDPRRIVAGMRESTQRMPPPANAQTPKRGEERVVQGVTYVWRTINGQSGWMKK